MEKSFYVDVDKAIEHHNLKHPESKIDRTQLAKKMGVSYQTLVNFQNGRVPAAIGRLNQLLTLTEASFADVVKPNQNGNES